MSERSYRSSRDRNDQELERSSRPRTTRTSGPGYQSSSVQSYHADADSVSFTMASTTYSEDCPPEFAGMMDPGAFLESFGFGGLPGPEANDRDDMRLERGSVRSSQRGGPRSTEDFDQGSVRGSQRGGPGPAVDFDRGSVRGSQRGGPRPAEDFDRASHHGSVYGSVRGAQRPPFEKNFGPGEDSDVSPEPMEISPEKNAARINEWME